MIRRAVFAVIAAVAVGAGSAPVTIAAPDTEPDWLALSIDSVTPQSVTTTSDPTVSVTATVTNVGDRPVDEVNVRIQRAPAINAAPQLRTSLTLDQYNFDVAGEFVTVADRIPPGQHKQFTLSMPLRGTPASGAPTLQIAQPGVYPMLLNVNGAPEYGADARLDDARFLLPVLGMPPDPTAADPLSEGARPVAPSTVAPVATTLLWPLADRPRIVAGNPGSLDQPVILTDDDLATSLALGGRLEQLVSALELAIGPDIDRTRELTDSTCLAIDPDLLLTVSAMTRGYRVVAADPAQPATDGTGAAAAVEWLDRLRVLAAQVCTVALPYAQVDLPAVRTVDDPELTIAAIRGPADVIDSILGVASVRAVTWPDSGSIDDDTGAFLNAAGTDTILVAADAIDVPSPTPEIVRVAGTDTPSPVQGDNLLHAAPFDVQSAIALAAIGDVPETPSFTPTKSRYNLTADSRRARLQAALGAIAWPALDVSATRDAAILIAPPQNFGADRDEAAAVLAEVSTLLRSGLASPRRFVDLLARPPAPVPADLLYLQQAVNDAVPGEFVGSVDALAPRVDALVAALVEDPTSQLTPRLFGSPLREDLLRALSLSGRRTSQRADSEDAARMRLARSTVSLDNMFGAVTVIAPGGGYTLASEQSPLVLVAKNDLPIGINVRLRVDAPPDMTITDIGEQQLPARGSRALLVPARVSDTRNLFVDVALTTPTGHELGEPTTVSVRSNAYGRALAIITGCAGGLLLLLAGRRLLHRFRGQPDPADEGHERV